MPEFIDISDLPDEPVPALCGSEENPALLWVSRKGFCVTHLSKAYLYEWRYEPRPLYPFALLAPATGLDQGRR